MKYKFKTACLILSFTLVACAATQPQIKMGQSHEAQYIREEVTWSSHKKPPVWYLRPPEGDGKYDYFVGHSVKFATEPGARDDAMANAIKQFVRYCGVEVNIFDEYLKVTTGKTSSVLAGVLSKREHEQQQAKGYVTSIKPKEWYIRRIRIYHDGTPIDSGYKASALIMAPVEEKARVQAYAEKRRQEEVLKINEAFKPARTLYTKAKDYIGRGDILSALGALDKAWEIVNRVKADYPKAGLNQEDEMIGMERENLRSGITLTKVSGDGQKIKYGEQLASPLAVRVMCHFEGREIPLRFAPVIYRVEFEIVERVTSASDGVEELLGEISRVESEIVERVTSDKDGMARLKTFSVVEEQAGQIKIIAGLDMEPRREVYFTLWAGEPIPAISVEVSFIYEDNGVPRQMWDGMSLRSRLDYYSVYFSPEQDCYVYIYQVDSSGAVYQIFPNLEYSNAWNPVKKGKDYWIPANDRFYLDDVTGEEKIYFFASREPATELENLFARLKQADNRQEMASLQGQINDMLYTRGIGGTEPGNTHPVIAKSGHTFDLISQTIESIGPEFMYCLTLRHVGATYLR